MEPIGVRLKRLRLERGLSQRELSSPGCSYAYISRIEAGARTPSVKTLRKIAARLGVSTEYLETGAESPIEAGCRVAGLSVGDLTPDERKLVDRAAYAHARLGAYLAAERVVRARNAELVEQMKNDLAKLRLLAMR